MNLAMSPSIQSMCESSLRLQHRKMAATLWRIVPTSTSARGDTGAVTLHSEIYRQLCEGGVWFPHTSLPTQGSLTVTYVRGDRGVMGENMCVSLHQFCSALMETNHIWSREDFVTVLLWCTISKQGFYKCFVLSLKVSKIVLKCLFFKCNLNCKVQIKKKPNLWDIRRLFMFFSGIHAQLWPCITKCFSLFLIVASCLSDLNIFAQHIFSLSGNCSRFTT